jgi:hypothetical protein
MSSEVFAQTVQRQVALTQGAGGAWIITPNGTFMAVSTYC